VPDKEPSAKTLFADSKFSKSSLPRALRPSAKRSSPVVCRVVGPVLRTLLKQFEHLQTETSHESGRDKTHKKKKTMCDLLWPLSLLLLLNSHRRGFMHAFHIWPDIGKGAKAT